MIKRENKKTLKEWRQLGGYLNYFDGVLFIQDPDEITEYIKKTYKTSNASDIETIAQKIAYHAMLSAGYSERYSKKICKW